MGKVVELEDIILDTEWPSDRQFQVIGMGRNAVDWIYVLPHFPRHGGKIRIEKIYKSGGGEIATATALCARYGLKVRYIGRVGDDEVGDFCLRDLEPEPMDISCVDVVPGASSQLGIILVDRPTGERTVLWDRDPALHYKEGELQREWIVDGQLLHLDGHDQRASIQAARWAKEAQMKVSLDIDEVQSGVEELLGLADFVIPTIEFVQDFTNEEDWRKGLSVMASLVPGLLAVTRGREGAAVFYGGKIFEFSGITVDTLDTTGAGDIFHGAFLYGLFQGESLGFCFRLANTAAALSCTRFGARPGIARLEEVLSALQ